MSKTFFTHTTKLEVVKNKLVPASTIAIKKVGERFHYGVAICSKYDNFSKKYGREVAEKRLNEGFGALDVPAPLKNVNEKEAILAQLYNLAASVVVKNKKWKRRITKFNQNQNEGGKIISITALNNAENKN